MKRMLKLAMILALMLSLTACSTVSTLLSDVLDRDSDNLTSSRRDDDDEDEVEEKETTEEWRETEYVIPETAPEDESDEPVNPVSKTLTIPTIKTVSLTVDPYREVETEAVNVDFLYYSGNISSNQQEDYYTFTAPVSGTYRFELKDMHSSHKVSVYLYDSNDDRLSYISGKNNGHGITHLLNGGETYKVKVSAYDGTGKYTLLIGQQKAPVDLTGYTSIADSIEFNGQTNYYTYTPAVSGEYRLYISQINSGTKVSIFIYDDEGYRLTYDSHVSRNEGLNVTLTAGMQYSITVEEYEGYGEYTFCIGPQKETVDITGYTVVNDSMQFKNQWNYYTFTPDIDGTYRFEVAQIDSGNNLNFYLYDSQGYQVSYRSNLRNGEGITETLEAGECYTFAVKYAEGLVPYQFTVGCQKPMQDISKYHAVSDSIQYKSQMNTYSFTAPKTGTYTFRMSGIENGFEVSLQVCDSAMYPIRRTGNMEEGDCMTLDLTEGATYYIHVEYCNGYNTYTLNITAE